MPDTLHFISWLVSDLCWYAAALSLHLTSHPRISGAHVYIVYIVKSDVSAVISPEPRPQKSLRSFDLNNFVENKIATHRNQKV